ncbi:hypothetical protein ACKWTF_007042 [Chironomus riparius]
MKSEVASDFIQWNMNIYGYDTSVHLYQAISYGHSRFGDCCFALSAFVHDLQTFQRFICKIMMSFTLTDIMTAYGSKILINEAFICINANVLLIVAVCLEYLMMLTVLPVEMYP